FHFNSLMAPFHPRPEPTSLLTGSEEYLAWTLSLARSNMARECSRHSVDRMEVRSRFPDFLESSMPVGEKDSMRSGRPQVEAISAASIRPCSWASPSSLVKA